MERTTFYKQLGDGQFANFVARVQNAGGVVRLINAATYEPGTVRRPNTNRTVVFIVDDLHLIDAEQALQIFTTLILLQKLATTPQFSGLEDYSYGSC